MKERSPKSAIFLILIILLVIGAVVAAVLLLRTDSVEERIKKQQLIGILFTAHEGGSVRLIEVLLFNPENKKSAVLFLPNTAWLMLESLNRYDKLEKLYAPGKPSLLLEKIEWMIDIKIPYFIDLEMGKLTEVVDLLAGVELFIPASVNQKVGDRLFLFESGGVVLDGDKAAAYLTLEIDNESDMEKAQRRQDFLKALLARLARNGGSGFLKKPAVFSALYDRLHTNLSSQEFGTLVRRLEDLNVEGMLYRRVHGIERLQNNERIFIPNDQGDQLRKTMAQAVEFLRNNELLRPEDLVVRLEILNGTDIAFRARDAARIFKKYGYEVLREDNASDKPVKKTVVVDYRGNQKMAREIAAVIKCANVEQRPEAGMPVDFSVILGMDFDGQYCQ